MLMQPIHSALDVKVCGEILEVVADHGSSADSGWIPTSRTWLGQVT
jgi:hypothetical protein